MPSFIQDTTHYLYHTYRKNLSKWHIILPTRRACLYFKNELESILDEDMVAPYILSMDDFIQKMSQLHIIEDIFLVLDLYQCYQKNTALDEKPEAFSALALTIIKDFSLIDYSLSNQKALALFASLDENKALERWGASLGDDDESSSMKKFLNFFTYTKKVYTAFKEKLLSEQKAYSGLAYRYVYDHIETVVSNQRINGIAFVGFGQLHTVELDIIKYFVEEKGALTFWDVDEFYIQNKNHLAGKYYRNYKAKGLGKTPLRISKSISQTPKNIHFYQSNNVVAQTKLASHIVAQILDKIHKDKLKDDQLPSCVIILPDESLLMSLLYSLPQKIRFKDGTEENLRAYLNITMGVGIRHTPFLSFLQYFFRVKENILLGEEGYMLYSVFALELLEHPYIASECREVAQKIREERSEQGNIYIDIKEFWQKYEVHPLASVFIKAEELSLENALSELYTLLQALYGIFEKEGLTLEQEILFKIITVLKRLENSFK